MDSAEALNRYLLSQSTITAIVGQRIYPLAAPVDCEYPVIVYQKISDVPYHSMGADAEIYSPRYQISMFSKTYSGARTLAATVKNAMRDVSGTWGGAGGVVVQKCLFEFETERYDFESGDTNSLYFVSQDYIIWHE